MDEDRTAEALARIWIEAWNEGQPDRIPLAETFTHTSPFGRVEGRETYLEWVKPLAAENVADLRIVRTLAGAGGDEAVIHFEMKTDRGWVPGCDWVVAEAGEIAAIHSFYDASGMRGRDYES